MESFFLIAFAIESAVHLYASLKKDVRLRAMSKIFLIPLLLGWYWCSVAVPSWIVVAALVMSWLGDVFLIKKGTKPFIIGGTAFGLSHLFFCIAYAQHTNFDILPWWVIAVGTALYFTVVWFLFKSYKPHLPKPLFWPMFAYLLVNGAMNCFALFQLVSNPCNATLITYIGAVLFFTSDSILFSVRFNKNSRFKSHFPVMLTYLLGEMLITWGLILITK